MSLHVAVQFVNFKISYTKFVVEVAIDESSTHIKGQFGGFLMKNTPMLNILQRVKT